MLSALWGMMFARFWPRFQSQRRGLLFGASYIARLLGRPRLSHRCGRESDTIGRNTHVLFRIRARRIWESCSPSGLSSSL